MTVGFAEAVTVGEAAGIETPTLTDAVIGYANSDMERIGG